MWVLSVYAGSSIIVDTDSATWNILYCTIIKHTFPVFVGSYRDGFWKLWGSTIVWLDRVFVALLLSDSTSLVSRGLS